MAVAVFVIITVPCFAATPNRRAMRGFLGNLAEVEGLGEGLAEQLLSLVDAELGGMEKNNEKLGRMQASLEPMFSALPKNGGGKVGRSAVCYALQRYFLQEYGWLVSGLAPQSSKWSWSESSPFLAIEGRVPAGLQELLEQGLSGHGLNLKALTVLAFLLERVLLEESDGWVEAAFRVVGAHMHGRAPAKKVQEAIDIYMMTYSQGLDLPHMSTKAVFEERDSITDESWAAETTWIHELQKDAAYALRRTMNPFVKGSMTLQAADRIVNNIHLQHRNTQHSECRKLKDKLHQLEDFPGSGRVALSQFQNNSFDEHWKFEETTEELRTLGALDESIPSRPRVVVPNYVYSKGNCLAASTLHRVCCPDECEMLMAELEKTIAAPTALPAAIASLVESRLASTTVPAPRNIPPALLQKLEDVAARNGGRVPLHGRLFAQWMHHAFPFECAHPQTTKATPVILLESMQEQQPGQADASAQQALLPWSEEERLLTDGEFAASGGGHVWAAEMVVFLLAIIFVVVVASTRIMDTFTADKWEKGLKGGRLAV